MSKRLRKRDDIYAIEAGTVLYALKTASDYGHRIYIRHLDGSTAMYGHLSEFHVKEGDVVEAGTLIATMGDTGYSLNNKPAKHLHVSYFSPNAKKLNGSSVSDGSFWIQLGYWPTNTKVSNPYGSKYHSPNLEKHEGIDFSYKELVDGWEDGVDALYQDMLLKRNNPEYYYEE